MGDVTADSIGPMSASDLDAGAAANAAANAAVSGDFLQGHVDETESVDASPSRKERASSELGGSVVDDSARVSSASASAGSSVQNDDHDMVVKLQNYLAWKRNIPLLYDALVVHHCNWPSLALQWGPVVDPGSLKVDAYGRKYFSYQKLYFSQQTDGSYNSSTHCWTGTPALVQVNVVEFPKPWCTPRPYMNKFRDGTRSTFMTTKKQFAHPGEVNRIRVSPTMPHVIATQTDSSKVFIWNTLTQADRSRQVDSSMSNCPDVLLIGHKAKAEYALRFFRTSHRVVSGGSDHQVLVWDLGDHETRERADDESTSPQKRSRHGKEVLSGDSTVFVQTGQGSMPASRGGKSSKQDREKHRTQRQEEWDSAPRIRPRHVLQGHSATVEDVDVHPASDHLLCSVGDDRMIKFWDLRTSSAASAVDGGAVVSVANAHTADINCCAWNPVETNYVLTGSSDSTTNLYDWRRATRPLRVFRDHGVAEVMSLQWAPHGDHFASSGSDSVVRIWTVDHPCFSGVEAGLDEAAVAHTAAGSTKGTNESPSDRCLLFRHTGHRSSIVDLHWNPHQPWVLASISDDNSDEVNNGGSTLQIWRVNELLHSGGRVSARAVPGVQAQEKSPSRRRNAARRN